MAVSLLALCALSPLASAEMGQEPQSFEAQLRASRARLDHALAQREDAHSKLAEVARQTSELEQRLRTDGRALYRLSRNGLLPLTAGFEGLIGHASRVERLERMVRTDLRAFSALQERQGELRREVEKAAQGVVDAEASVRSEEKALAERMRLLAAETSAREERERASAAAAAAATSSSRLSYGLSVSGPAAPRTSFTEQRGQLALPISGPSSIREATRAESSGPGLEFLVGRGASVRAAAGGQVVFADRYGSYGSLVILDHGNRYYTAYGGFSSLEVQVGDEVSKSARLGLAGADPIYFEVRRGTRTESARSWLGL